MKEVLSYLRLGHLIKRNLCCVKSRWLTFYCKCEFPFSLFRLMIEVRVKILSGSWVLPVRWLESLKLRRPIFLYPGACTKKSPRWSSFFDVFLSTFYIHTCRHFINIIFFWYIFVSVNSFELNVDIWNAIYWQKGSLKKHNKQIHEICAQCFAFFHYFVFNKAF